MASAIYKERYKETAEIQQIETVIEKEVNILKTWQKVLMWLGAISVIIVIGYLLIKFSTILRDQVQKYVFR